MTTEAARRTWDDLSEAEQARVTRLLTPDPDDNLDALLARCERAIRIIRGEEEAEPTVPEHPAALIVHWPTGPVACCVPHAEQLVGLGRAMGTHVVVSPVTELAECENCKNGGRPDA